MSDPLHQGTGYWDCDCGRERREPGLGTDCRAFWVDTGKPFTESDKAQLRALGLALDLKAAARLLTEHGYTVTPPEASHV